MKRLPILLLLLLVPGCGKLAESPTDPGVGGGEPPDPTATFTRVQNEIFTPTCAMLGCHSSLAHQESQILSAGNGYTNTVNVASVEMPSLVRIKPGDPA